MRALLRDPLIHCLVAGVLLFALDAALEARDDSVIRVGRDDLRRLSDQWRSQLGRAPTADELDALIHEHVQEEVLVREAERLGLAERDVVIRRRLVQKLRFVTEDLAVAEPPTETQLLAHYESAAGRYREPARVSFSHVFLGLEHRADAEADALELLADPSLGEEWRALGDPFILRRSYSNATRREVARDFGDVFAAALAELPPRAWTGPIRSGLGVHLVRIDGRIDSRSPSLEQVRDRVVADLDAARRSESNQRRIAELVAGYRVEIER